MTFELRPYMVYIARLTHCMSGACCFPRMMMMMVMIASLVHSWFSVSPFPREGVGQGHDRAVQWLRVLQCRDGPLEFKNTLAQNHLLLQTNPIFKRPFVTINNRSSYAHSGRNTTPPSTGVLNTASGMSIGAIQA